MNRSVWLIVGSILLVALLGAAAYMGGKLLSNKPLAGIMGVFTGSAGTQGGTVGQNHASLMPWDYVAANGHLNPAAELPQTPADVEGICDHVADRSVFVKTSSGPITVGKGDGGVATNADGPVVEAVINQETKIYKDTTRWPSNFKPGDTVQQTVVEGSLDEIDPYPPMPVNIWGNRSGDRIVATALVYLAGQ